MSDRVLLLVPRTPDAPWQWAQPPVRPGAVPRAGTATSTADLVDRLGAAAGEAGAATVTVIVPGESVLSRPVRLTARSESQARAAVSFLLEDDVAVEDRALHFAVGPAGDGQSATGANRLAAAVSTDVMTEWLAPLRHPALRLDEVIPDYVALLPPAGKIWLIDRGALVSAALSPAEGGPAFGFTTDRGLVPIVMPDLLEQAPDAPVRIFSDSGADLTPENGWGERVVDRRPGLSDTEFVSAAAAQDRSRSPISLAQGPFAPRSPWRASVKAWRTAAGLAAGLVLAVVATTALDAYRLHARADALTAQAETVFREAFPDIKRVVNPRTQMSNQLAALRGQGGSTQAGYLDLSVLLYESLSDVDGVWVESLRFDERRREMTVSLNLRSFAAIEDVRLAVERRGGRLEEGASRQLDDRVAGDVVISRS